MSEPQPPDLESIFEQALVLQNQMIEARDRVASELIEGSSAGGGVTVGMTGDMEFRSVHIDPTLLDDVEILEDLVLAALRDVANKLQQLNDEATDAIGPLFD